jgi:hypothetical protein
MEHQNRGIDIGSFIRNLAGALSVGIIFPLIVQAQLVLGASANGSAPLLSASPVSIIYNTAEGYCRFIPGSTATYTILTTGPADDFGTIYSSAMTVLASDDDAGGGGNFKIIRALTAGQTYYIGIKSWDGNGALASLNISGGALPVELQSFTASGTRNGAVLAWHTATEVNNYGFDVERKTGGTWGKIGFVEGHGSTNVAQSYSFDDDHVTGKVVYRLKQIDRDGTYEYSKEVEVTADGGPAEFALAQNYPNPFNPTTEISFTVSTTGYATLKVYNTLGQEVVTLFEGIAQSGISHQVQFRGSEYSSGIYFSRLEYAGKVQFKKMTLLK